MKGKTARLLVLGICIVLAVLILTKIITHLASGLIFAIVLVTVGVMSRGFTK
jgi:hypothetical protein